MKKLNSMYVLRFLFLFSLFFVGRIEAEEIDEEDLSEMVILSKEEVHKGDFFASGKNVEISGVVKGDLYIFGGQVFIDGIVTGDVLVAGGNVHISGKVGNNVRLIGGQVILTGKIGRNVTLIAGNAELSSSSQITGDLIALTGNLDLDGKVNGNARIFTSNVRISGETEENLKVYSTQMRITSRAYIGGTLDYWSNTPALIDSNARIDGEIIHHPSFFYNLAKGKLLKGFKLGSKFVTLLMNFLYTFVIGILLIYFFYPKVERSLAMLTKKPLETFIYGILVLILLPLISIMLLLSIVGVPFGLTLLAVNMVGFYTAKIISILWVVKKVTKKIGYKKHVKLYFTVGTIFYFMIVSIPFAGAFISLLAMIFGLGALVLGNLEKKAAVKSS